MPSTSLQVLGGRDEGGGCGYPSAVPEPCAAVSGYSHSGRGTREWAPEGTWRVPNPERTSRKGGWVPASQDVGPLPLEPELTLQLIGPRRAGACVPGSRCGRQKGRKSAFCSEGGATARGPSLPYLCACQSPSASWEDLRESVRAAIPKCEDAALDVRTTCFSIKLQTFLFLNPKNIGGFCPLLEEGAQGS